MPEDLADQEIPSVTILLANAQRALRQAISSSHSFQESWVFKTPSPKIRGWKSWIHGIHALLEILSSYKLLQGCKELELAEVYMLGHGHACCLHGPGDGGWSQPVLTWPRHMATCRPLGLCHCLMVWCRVSFQLWQQIPGPATCKLQWWLPVQC